MSPIIPPPAEFGEPVASNVRVPQKRWDDLDAIAEQETKLRGRKFSRNEVADHFLRWGIIHYRQEREESSGALSVEVRIQQALERLNEAQAELTLALQEVGKPPPKKRDH